MCNDTSSLSRKRVVTLTTTTTTTTTEREGTTLSRAWSLCDETHTQRERERERENKRKRASSLPFSCLSGRKTQSRDFLRIAFGRQDGNIPKNRYAVLLLGEMERRTKMSPITSVRRARSKMSRRSKERLRCVYVLLKKREILSLLSSNGLFLSSSSFSSSSSSSSKCPPRSRYVYVAKYSRTFDSIER